MISLGRKADVPIAWPRHTKIMEDWQSGLSHSFAKAALLNRGREFESHIFLQTDGVTCNGCTRGFDPLVEGSIPSALAKQLLSSSMVEQSGV